MYKEMKGFKYGNHLCYRLKNDKTGKEEIVRADKMVYSMFCDKTGKLNPADDSWDVEHIDGDWKNCAWNNLRRIR